MNGPGRRVRVMDSLNQTPGEDQGEKGSHKREEAFNSDKLPSCSSNESHCR